jgi:hypothetical protein
LPSLNWNLPILVNFGPLWSIFGVCWYNLVNFCPFCTILIAAALQMIGISHHNKEDEKSKQTFNNKTKRPLVHDNQKG